MEPLYNGHLWGTMFWPYTEVAFVESLFCTQTVHYFGTWVTGRYRAAGLYLEVVVNVQRFHCISYVSHLYTCTCVTLRLHTLQINDILIRPTIQVT